MSDKSLDTVETLTVNGTHVKIRRGETVAS